MALPNPYAQYQHQSVMTASPGDLTLMLYNGCIKFIKQGQVAVEQKDISGAHSAIRRAQDIILEFMATLDMQIDLSHNLVTLYEYINQRLAEANIRKDNQILAECLGLVTELRDTWAEVVRLNRGHK
ncbi:MAG: flagellar biosynthesis protein FliS [Bacillota bacterium]|nr:MAG: flagellar biosynthesis protein FliS [Bacillota bacterium]MBS3951275.1 flagellar export chaperone FliS [Peptococcaceae bacterium]